MVLRPVSAAGMVGAPMTSSEKPKIWMPLYVDAWDRDTRKLTPEEDGCYGRIIRDYWVNGPPDNNDGDLAALVGLPMSRWLKVRPRLDRFFTVEDGKLRNKRCDDLRVEWTERKAIAKERASKGAQKRWSKDASSIKQAVQNDASLPLPSSATLEDPSGHSSASGKAIFSNLDLREKAIQRMGLEWVVSWLDPAEWRDLPTKAIVARNGIGADKIRRELRPLLADIAVEVRQVAA